MDIQMPYISGLELIEQLKADAELRPIPIMAVTAYAAKGDEERIRDAGAEGYVSKPISVIRFVEAVRALLAAPRKEQEPVAEPEVEAEVETPAREAIPAEPEMEEAASPEGDAASEDDRSGEAPEGQPPEGQPLI